MGQLKERFSKNRLSISDSKRSSGGGQHLCLPMKHVGLTDSGVADITSNPKKGLGQSQGHEEVTDIEDFEDYPYADDVD